MGVDKFKFHKTEMETFIKSLYALAIKYKKKIYELQLLVNEINTSSSWKDEMVKTEFITTCDSYITIYNELIDTIFSRIKFLINKSRKAVEIESRYKKVQ